MSRREKHLGLAIFAVVFAIPLISTSYSLIHAMVFIGIYALVALGLSLLVSYTGQISIGHAGFMAIGAYTSAIITTNFQTSPWIAMVFAVLVTLAISYAVGLPSLKLSGHYLAMATLGLGLVINVLLVELSWLTGGVDGISNIPGLSIFKWELLGDKPYYYLIWLCVFLAAVISCNIINSKIGRALRAIQHDEIVAASFGIKVQNYKVIIFLFSTCLAAIAGSFMAHYMTFISPEPFSLMLSIQLILMAILGGRVSPLGGIVGAVIIGGLPQVLRAYQDFSIGIFGLMLILIMLFLPKGILGLFDFKVKKRGSGISLQGKQ